MIELVLVLQGLLFVAGTIALAWSAYFLVRWVMPRRADEDPRRMAENVVARIGALHGLILALVFAQEIIDYHELRSTVLEEATAISEIAIDIGRYDSQLAADIREDLTEYTRIVAEEEWVALAERNELDARAWHTWSEVYDHLLALEPATDSQKLLKSHMIEQIQLIEDLRQKRHYVSLQGFHLSFWIAAIAGLVAVAGSYFGFPPTPQHLLLLSTYSGFVGMILFVIFAFADPYTPPGVLEPDAFQSLLRNGSSMESPENGS